MTRDFAFQTGKQSGIEGAVSKLRSVLLDFAFWFVGWVALYAAIPIVPIVFVVVVCRIFDQSVPALIISSILAFAAIFAGLANFSAFERYLQNLRASMDFPTVKPFQPRSRQPRPAARTKTTRLIVPSVERFHANVLGLHDAATIFDVQKAYRAKMAEYHPDRVAHLGIKLREVAEAECKRINAAYAYFQAKHRESK